MTATGRWLLNFLIWSVHVSTYVEVDTMVLRIPSDSKVTSPLAYLAVPGMRESIKAGMAEPLAKSSKALKW